MARGEFETVTNSVTREVLLETVRDYGAYPEFLKGVHGIEVTRLSDDQARVVYDVDLGQRVRYTLLHTEHEDGNSWELEEGGKVLAVNNGRWVISEEPGSGLRIRYELELKLRGLVPDFIVGPMIQRSLPELVQGMLSRASRRSSPHK